MPFLRALAVTCVLVAAAGGCGGDADQRAAEGATTSGRSATSGTTPATPAPTSATAARCTPDELRAFVDVTRDLGIAYDYEPSASPAELAERAELVVSGSVVDVDADGQELLFTFAVDEVVRGALDASAPLTVVVDFVPAVRPVDEVRDVLVTDADALFFLAGGDEGTRWHPLLEGMWLSCGDAVAAARVAPVDWDVTSLDDLADAVRTAG